MIEIHANLSKYASSERTHRSGADQAARKGITVLEVLFSILILAVGLLSVASLLPVGRLQAGRALVDQHKVIVGQNALNEFRIRDMANPDKWYDATGSLLNQYPAGAPPVINARIPVVIDPLTVSRHGSSVQDFPINGYLLTGVPASLPRVSISSGSATLPLEVANEIFMAKDDILFDLPDDPTLPPVGGFGKDGKKRLFEGQFSWMATIVPEYGPIAPTSVIPEVNQHYRLSIVVFHRRSLTQAGMTTAERAVKFNFAPPEIELVSTLSPPDDLKVTIGEWILLGANFNRITSTGTTELVPIFKWYRIVSAAQFDPTSTKRRLTVAGPDWENANNPTGEAVAILVDGVVAVYEKTIRIEGNNAWSVAP